MHKSMNKMIFVDGVCVCDIVFEPCVLCLCVGSGVCGFHSCIKRGHSPRGLQVNVAYFKRLLLLGHSVSVAHMQSDDSHALQNKGCFFLA